MTASTRKRILVGAQDSGLCLTLTGVFAREGFYAAMACDTLAVREAIDATEPPDVLILDDSLGMDRVGVLLHHCRATPSFAHTKVIVLAGQDSEEDEVAMLNLGAADYLRKPLRTRALVARVNKA